ncbi:helix-turn-helix domain-containing protein [Mycolicibacter algericus]|uniref:helix-turn-helix domain-containing protein n=1 Tax=Mycolicibacter algericus TaxID=1288388 RepID=UPI003C7655B3
MSSSPGKSNKVPSGYLSIAQSAEYLGVTTRTIRQMIADGRLTGYRSGTRLVRLRYSDIDAAMQPFGGCA